MMRSGYRTTARPFRDSAVTVDVQWYKCAPGAPTLGFESCLNSLDWAGFPWLRRGPGEVFNAPREYHQANPIAGADGHHVCGTEEDFRDGERYLPDLPPVEYSPEGLPRCCGVVGGVVLGGSGFVPQAVGAAVVGGPTDPGPTYTDSCVVSVANPSALGTTYWEYKNPFFGTFFRWFTWGMLPAGTYTITARGCGVESGIGLWVREAVTCDSFISLFIGVAPDEPFTVTLGGTRYLQIRVSAGSPPAFYYDIRVD